jgi:spermidine/putrescine transport system substrate-binding protein
MVLFQGRMMFFDQKQVAMQFRNSVSRHSAIRVLLLIPFLLILQVNGCTPQRAVTTETLAGQSLILYNWASYLPQSVLDAFTAKYGVTVSYLTYGSMEEAVAELRRGKACDVVVLENNNIRPLSAEGLLAEIDYQNIPNFKNISPNFRDLALDPDNRYSIPFDYGTTGLLVRTDLVKNDVRRWSDLWDAKLPGKIAVRSLQYELIAISLKSLGYPLNSEDPQQLEAALQRLLELKPYLVYVDDETDKALPTLLRGEAAIMVGWGNDAIAARRQNESVAYVLPEEGTLLWGESFVIPASSAHKSLAELFLNFLLRPEISAQIANESHYATANQAAYPFIEPDLIANEIVFPPAEVFRKSDWYLPLSPAGETLYGEVWDRFLAGTL